MPEGTRFEIVEIAGTGAYGTVVVAHDRARPDAGLVAVKVLSDAIAHDPDVLRRLRDEARMLCRLRDARVVAVHELLEVGGQPIVVMERLQGRPLDSLLKEWPDGLPTRAALEIVRQAALGLDAAWSSPAGPEQQPLRIVHRDVSPGNLLLTVQGVVKVLDFGLAKGEFGDREAKTVFMVVGARGYAAPERSGSGANSPKVDVWSLGIVLFELIAGRPMVLSVKADRHPEGLERALAHLQPEEVDPEPIRALLRRMCAHAPEARPTAAEVAAAIETILGDPVDLAAFAAEVVAPSVERTTPPPKETHPRWEEVRFLERIPQSRGRGGPVSRESADAMIRRFLAGAGWEARVEELRTLLHDRDDWTEDPFLELLARLDVPWWRFWVRATPPVQGIAALDLLRLRSHRDRVVALAKQLSGHSDDGIARAARAILEG